MENLAGLFYVCFNILLLRLLEHEIFSPIQKIYYLELYPPFMTTLLSNSIIDTIFIKIIEYHNIQLKPLDHTYHKTVIISLWTRDNQIKNFEMQSLKLSKMNNTASNNENGETTLELKRVLMASKSEGQTKTNLKIVLITFIKQTMQTLSTYNQKLKICLNQP